MKLGRQQRNKQGKYCGTAIFGYRVQTLEYHSARRQVTTLVVLPEEAALVQHIFTLYSNGLGLKAIMNRLNRSRFTTKEGKPFSIGTIHQVLHNVVYIGKIRYLDNQTKKETIVDGDHEPIIPFNLWCKVQQKFTGKSGRPKKKNPNDSLLTSLLRCPACHSGTVSWQTKRKQKNDRVKWYRYYMCSKYHNQGSTACKSNLIPADAIERRVFGQLKELILHPKLLGDIVTKVNRQTTDLLYSLKEQDQILEKKLKDWNIERAEVFNLFEQDAIGQKELSSRLRRIKQAIDMLNSERNKLQAKIEEHEKKKISFPAIQKALEQFDILWKPEPAAKKRELLRAMIDRITIDSDRQLNSVQIHLKKFLLDIVVPTSNTQLVS